MRDEVIDMEESDFYTLVNTDRMGIFLICIKNKQGEFLFKGARGIYRHTGFGTENRHIMREISTAYGDNRTKVFDRSYEKSI